MTAREIMLARAELLASIARAIDAVIASGLDKGSIQLVLEQALEILGFYDQV